MTRRSLGIAGPALLLGLLLLELRMLKQPALCQRTADDSLFVVLGPVLFFSGIAVTAITRRYIGVMILMCVLGATLFVYVGLRAAAVCAN